MKMPWHKLDPDERIGAPILIRELGLWRAIKLGKKVRTALKQGRPFQSLPPAANAREVQSRAQIGRAIVMYQELLRKHAQPDALRITQAVVTAAACRFLREQLGSLDRDTIRAVDPSERTAWIQDKGARFFNATTRWDRIDEDAVDFTVTACTFPALCAQCGVPELAPVFCAGDAAYFGSVEKNVTLERPATIAAGADHCAFKLRFATPQAPVRYSSSQGGGTTALMSPTAVGSANGSDVPPR